MSKYAIGSFEATDRSWQFICKDAMPRAPHIFVKEKILGDDDGNEYWPKVGQYYIIKITRGSTTGRSLHGEVVLPIKAMASNLSRHSVRPLGRWFRLNVVVASKLSGR